MQGHTGRWERQHRSLNYGHIHTPKKYDFWKCKNKFTASRLQHLLPLFVATKHQTLSTNSVKHKSQTPLKDKTQLVFLFLFFGKGV